MDKVYGPYADRNRHRLVIVTRAGDATTRETVFYASEDEAKAAKAKLIALAEVKTVEIAIDDFMQHRRRNGTRESTLATVNYRLRGILKPVLTQPLSSVKAERCAKLYDAYCAGADRKPARARKPDTHQGALAIAKAMFEWARKAKLIQSNPWLDIDRIGRKSRRKNQLRLDEARKLTAYLAERADSHDGSLGVLLALVLGLRAHEVVGIVARDLDDGGKLLHIAKSKTAAGERALELPDALRRLLTSRAEHKQPDARLLPYKPGWVREHTQRACAAVGIPVVCAQALRGSHATFALDAGVSGRLVAEQLGHNDQGKVARGSYAKPGAGRSAGIGALAERIGLGFSHGVASGSGSVLSTRARRGTRTPTVLPTSTSTQLLQQN